MYHDRLNLLVRGSRRHGIELCGNSSMFLDLVCFTPLSFALDVFEVVFDDPLFVLSDATFFFNADCVVALDLPDERVTFFPVEFLSDVLRDFDVEVLRTGILFNR